MTLSKSEEDYLKALFHLCIECEEEKAGTNQLADYLRVSPASVNNMLKRLKEKDLVDYQKYGKVELTDSGRETAVWLIRKHRLWETFLYRHMQFTWDEVHDVAEQLEHIQSAKLIAELDKFLGFPKTDPHGAIIPDGEGRYTVTPRTMLSELHAGDRCHLIAVADQSGALLQYASEMGLELNSTILVHAVRGFDLTMLIEVGGRMHSVSKTFADHLFVRTES